MVKRPGRPRTKDNLWRDIRTIDVSIAGVPWVIVDSTGIGGGYSATYMEMSGQVRISLISHDTLDGAMQAANHFVRKKMLSPSGGDLSKTTLS